MNLSHNPSPSFSLAVLTAILASAREVSGQVHPAGPVAPGAAAEGSDHDEVAAQLTA
jgi:hypothetical protein